MGVVRVTQHCGRLGRVASRCVSSYSSPLTTSFIHPTSSAKSQLLAQRPSHPDQAEELPRKKKQGIARDVLKAVRNRGCPPDTVLNAIETIGFEPFFEISRKRSVSHCTRFTSGK
eukprot:gb/GECG01004054.1/.p1 GENE.gb/GECG01004054.1/~~gb/GECG01004054.1/.p1  ORF type:complete len:115 (+),score=7.55 gb/GECG01004054.1/:1-345(+)